MHIVELRLSGFKSFVDPVRLVIEAGLTGVVGPNGCGKSNLLEAVRWAMGATSAKAMRGSDMDDVIFAGTNARPAREHAEVILVLDAEGAKPPPGVAPADTLEISRKIKREAGSTYRINGREVRAKDVQLLFADASTGANSPALVRQGQISELIAAKPENRRRILEEAAGIAGLHARRHEADLKLNAASANLLRLDEVASEIDAQRQALKRQARLAERYRGLADELRRTEALSLHRRWVDAAEALAATQGDLRAAERDVAEAATAASQARRAAEESADKLPALREEELVAATVLRRLEGERVGLERDLRDAEAIVARAVEALQRLDQEEEREARMRADAETVLARLEAEHIDLSGAGNDGSFEALEAALKTRDAARTEADAALQSLVAAAAEAQAQRAVLEANAREARARLGRAEERLALIARDIAAVDAPNDLAARIADAEARVVAAQNAADTARAAEAAAEAALKEADAALREADAARNDAERKRAEAAAEVRALEQLVSKPSGKSYPPVLGDIEAAPGYEKAVAAALGDDIEASLAAAAPLRWAGADPRAIQWPAGVTPLANFVTAPPALAARLALCGVVDRAEGPRMQKMLSTGARLVSVDGDLWRWDGFVRRDDAPAPAAARLEQRNRLTAARKELKVAEAAAETARKDSDTARKHREDADLQARAARQAAPAAVADGLRATASRDALVAEQRRLDERRDVVKVQHLAILEERDAAKLALGNAETARASAPVADESAIAAARTKSDAARAAFDETRASLNALKQAETARQMRLRAVETEQSDWARRNEAATRRLAEIDTARIRETKALDEAKAAPVRVTAALAQLADQSALAEKRRLAAADALSTAEKTAREADATARDAEMRHAERREARAGAEARAHAAAERLHGVEALAREQLSCAPEELAERAGPLMAQALGKAPLADIDRKLEKLRGEREAAGPVNLRAEEELEEVELRLATLARERADVDAAVQKLKQAIGRLNAEGRQRLLKAFEVVNANFARLFATLFEGGVAELRLTESEDPLAAGLDIFACPPGKRLSTLSLMSGGEQSLTATALIFAVFLANPAPICVLDEVDAPLDDANVDRFCRMLDEMRRLTDTRFLTITHNPVTMSRMDRLFGVTMAERGVSQIVAVDLQRATELVAAE
ncbi:MAG: chromosome segregation protein SMC [Hyphomonadaceae bacterium]|nr:chromosome segregation protein SMC [Hyphomonadaceae bacterium]